MAMIATTIGQPAHRHGLRTWIGQGAVGGMLAGGLLATFEVGVAVARDGIGTLPEPFRMVGAMALGPDALSQSYPAWPVALAAIAVHLILSAGFGAGIGLALAGAPAVTRTGWRLIQTTVSFGLLLWLINFYAVAPAAGWEWFAQETVPVVHLIAHAGPFGAMLGLFLNRTAARRTAVALIGPTYRSRYSRSLARKEDT